MDFRKQVDQESMMFQVKSCNFWMDFLRIGRGVAGADRDPAESQLPETSRALMLPSLILGRYLRFSSDREFHRMGHAN